MSKKSSNIRKETNKSHSNRFSDTAVDPNEILTKQFQQAFTTSYSSRTFERTVEGTTEITNSKTEQQKDEEFRNQFKAFKNNEDMSKSNIEKKDEHYAAMMLIQGIT
jgi:hypothetical protein